MGGTVESTAAAASAALGEGAKLSLASETE